MSQLTKNQQTDKDTRVSIINTVQTPLGFFVLVVLIVEVVFGVIATLSAGNDRTYLIVGMLVLIFILVLVVAAMALFRPTALYGIEVRPTDENSATQDAIPDNEQLSLIQFCTEVKIRVENAKNAAHRQRSLAERIAILGQERIPESARVY